MFTRPTSRQRPADTLAMLSSGEIIFPKEEHTKYPILNALPENINTNYTIPKKQVIVRRDCVCDYRNAVIISKKEAMNLKKNNESYMGGLGGGK